MQNISYIYQIPIAIILFHNTKMVIRELPTADSYAVGF